MVSSLYWAQFLAFVEVYAFIKISVRFIAIRCDRYVVLGELLGRQ